MIDYTDIAARIGAVPLRQGRRLIAIAGAPASGKSHLARVLADRIPNACVVPMDGYHHSNAELSRRGLLTRKGAPQTFDVAGLLTTLTAIRRDGEVSFPTFDRAGDCVVPQAGHVHPSDETILVEGNYLLLNIPPWNQLSTIWDFTIVLDVPKAELRARLIRRWVTHGYDPAGAVEKAEGNDLPNAQFVTNHSFPADMTVSQA